MFFKNKKSVVSETVKMLDLLALIKLILFLSGIRKRIKKVSSACECVICTKELYPMKTAFCSECRDILITRKVYEKISAPGCDVDDIVEKVCLLFAKKPDKKTFFNFSWNKPLANLLVELLRKGDWEKDTRVSEGIEAIDYLIIENNIDYETGSLLDFNVQRTYLDENSPTPFATPFPLPSLTFSSTTADKKLVQMLNQKNLCLLLEQPCDELSNLMSSQSFVINRLNQPILLSLSEQRIMQGIVKDGLVIAGASIYHIHKKSSFTTLLNLKSHKKSVRFSNVTKVQFYHIAKHHTLTKRV
jgi:hypothetical protein